MAIERLQVYKCEACGNIVEVITVGGGDLSCCGQPMNHLVENTTDAAQEKHVPVVNKIDGGYEVVVGEVAHPMQEAHLIEWIELITEDGVAYRQFLKPGEAPMAKFVTDARTVTVREFCNLHGLWRK